LKNTFSKEEKIQRKEDFRALFRKGQLSSGQTMQIFALPRADHARKIGFVFSRRVRPAVFRSRMRRLLREVYRLNKKKFVDGQNLLIRVNRPVEKPHLARIEKEFMLLARQVGALKTKDVSRETFYAAGEEA